MYDRFVLIFQQNTSKGGKFHENYFLRYINYFYVNPDNHK